MAQKITKQRIVDSFLNAAFYKSGGAVSLADISDSLGIKKASLYNYFESRDAIVKSVLDYCAERLSGISFIPSGIDEVVKKYPLETVFKGIVTRYVKMHEKSPLFQIYTFVQSQKYFDLRAARIVRDTTRKLEDQTRIVLETAVAEKKTGSLDGRQIDSVAKWFCAGINDFLSQRLLGRKRVIMENPPGGNGELFTLASDDRGIDAINALVTEFCALIK